MAKSKKFPRTLYKRDEKGKLSFTNKTHRDIRYNSVVVNDEEELKLSEEMGYVDNYSSILSISAKPELDFESEDEESEDEAEEEF